MNKTDITTNREREATQPRSSELQKTMNSTRPPPPRSSPYNLLQSNGGFRLPVEVCLKVLEEVINYDPKSVKILMVVSKVSYTLSCPSCSKGVMVSRASARSFETASIRSSNVLPSTKILATNFFLLAPRQSIFQLSDYIHTIGSQNSGLELERSISC